VIGRSCCRCQAGPLGDDQRVLVGVPFAMSGAGGPALYACLPCARVYARCPLAPDWIGEEIANTEARQQTNGP
jgi:hypothetical protein